MTLNDFHKFVDATYYVSRDYPITGLSIWVLADVLHLMIEMDATRLDFQWSYDTLRASDDWECQCAARPRFEALMVEYAKAKKTKATP